MVITDDNCEVMVPDGFSGTGWWSINGEDGGILIFENGFLIDYDGCYELPKAVCKAIEKSGFFLDEFIQQ